MSSDVGYMKPHRMGGGESHFNAPLIVRLSHKPGVHRPHILIKESRSGIEPRTVLLLTSLTLTTGPNRHTLPRAAIAKSLSLTSPAIGISMTSFSVLLRHGDRHSDVGEGSGRAEKAEAGVSLASGFSLFCNRVVWHLAMDRCICPPHTLVPVCQSGAPPQI